MGEFLRDYWYACGWDREIGREIAARTILGEPVILFRKEDGAPVALEDRCCHRNLPLSMGKLIGDRVQCGYHGLVFDEEGACVAVPGQTTIPPGAAIRSYPVVERHRFVWIWMGEPGRADPSRIPGEMRWNDAEGWRAAGASLRLGCDYRLLIDSLLDPPHETPLHMGAGVAAEAKREGCEVSISRRETDRAPPPFWKAAIGRAENCDRWQIARFAPPANICLDMGVAATGTGASEGDRRQGANLRSLNAVTPETEASCWLFWSFSRNFGTGDDALTGEIHETFTGVFDRTRRLVEAQQASLETAPAAFRFVDVDADAGTLHARRAIDDALRREAGRG